MGKTSGNTASRSRVLWSILLAAAVFLCFSPVLRNGFTGFDDPDYVTANEHVNTGLSGRNLVWALTAEHSSNWHPLTWISHQLDSTLFGLDPVGHHFTNLLLHTLNTVLLFLWLSAATGFRGRSAFVALIFGLHPLHVESVAWVSERKDVLSTLFGMLTLAAYSAYVKRPGIGRYAIVAGAFTASLLAKPMLVTLPVLLLLLDWWPYRRTEVRRAVLEKIPLLGLSALSSAATVWAQRRGGSVVSIEQLPVTLRLGNAAVSYLRYLGKAVWPVDLAAYYPFPFHGIPAWEWVGSVLVLAAVSALVWRSRRDHPWLAAGWGWYGLTLLPVIGIVQVGLQAMADRYMYVPMIGLLMAVAWEAGERLAPAAPRWLLPGAAALAAVMCAILSWRQIAVWQDGLTLFTHALDVTHDNFLAHDSLGVELDRRERYEEALAHYREALRIKPGDHNSEENYAQASFAKGERLFEAGKLDEALSSFQEGLRYRPRNALARTQTGRILTQERQYAAAMEQLRTALEIEPALAAAHTGMAVAYAWSGRAEDAAREFRETLRYEPSNLEANYDLGMVLVSMGRDREALDAFAAALRVKPDFGPAHTAQIEALARLRAKAGR